MYHRSYHSNMHQLSTQQHISLEKHQEMIDSVLSRQQHSFQAESRQGVATIARLRSVFAAIIIIVAK